MGISRRVRWRPEQRDTRLIYRRRPRGSGFLLGRGRRTARLLRVRLEPRGAEGRSRRGDPALPLRGLGRAAAAGRFERRRTPLFGRRKVRIATFGTVLRPG